jgi:glycine betaine/choline ABC-type transport system substrate-binding protein
VRTPLELRRDSVMKKARMRRRGLTLGAMALGVTLMMTMASPAFAGSGESLTVGSKDFSGAQALSQAYGQALVAKGFDVTFKDNIGPTEVVFAALKNGDLDAYADYSGTLLKFLGGEATSDSAETYSALKDSLKGTGIVASKPAPAIDVNGFYVTKATAKKYKLKTVTDLVDVADKLVFGGPPECLCASVIRRSSSMGSTSVR